MQSLTESATFELLDNYNYDTYFSQHCLTVKLQIQQQNVPSFSRCSSFSVQSVTTVSNLTILENFEGKNRSMLRSLNLVVT